MSASSFKFQQNNSSTINLVIQGNPFLLLLFDLSTTLSKSIWNHFLIKPAYSLRKKKNNINIFSNPFSFFPLFFKVINY